MSIYLFGGDIVGSRSSITRSIWGTGGAIHFSDPDTDIAGPGGDRERFVISETDLDVITRGGVDRTHWVRHTGGFEADGVVERARGQVGRRGYDLVWNNCEHFATWCCVGNRESRQVAVACERFASAGAKVAAGAAVRVAIRAGVRGIARGGSPYWLLADVAHWATEAGGHHVGLSDPRARDRAGRICGGVTALGLGALAGPVGVGMAGGMWAAGELASRFGRRTYDDIRRRRDSAAYHEEGTETGRVSDGPDSRASESVPRSVDSVPACGTPIRDGVDRE